MRQSQPPQRRCLLCGKVQGNHKSLSLACPVGMKTRVGYIHFHAKQFWTRPPDEMPQQGEFTL